MRHETFSAFPFNESEFTFDIYQYSRFKHGSISDAYDMAQQLFEVYEPNIPETDKEFVVFASPYHFIPSACSLIKDRFLVLLNRWLAKNNRLPAVESNIHRRLSYHSDYGKMSAQEREILIGGDKFYIDAEYIKDKFCLFLDDVRITGSHERQIEKLLNSHQEYQVIYFANYTGTGAATIESVINTAEVKSVVGLIGLMAEGDFKFNVRNIRMILTSENFKEFVELLGEDGREDLYDLCIGNHFHLVPLYKENLTYLESLI